MLHLLYIYILHLLYYIYTSIYIDITSVNHCQMLGSWEGAYEVPIVSDLTGMKQDFMATGVKQ